MLLQQSIDNTSPLYLHVTPILLCIGPCILLGSIWSMFSYNTVYVYNRNKVKLNGFTELLTLNTRQCKYIKLE